MSDPSPKSRQMTFADILPVTSSPESAGGPMPSVSPGGDHDGFGPAPVRASRTARRGSGSATPTSGTCGPTSSGSSASAALTRSLASKLRERFGTGGSIEFRQTWREKATPSGRRFWAHTASRHPTSDSGCSGWPTPDQSSGSGGRVSSDPLARKRPSGVKKALTINEAAQLASWNTPRATDGSKGGPNQAGGALPADAALASWATPAARDWESGDASEATMARNARPLNLAGWATPVVRDYRSSAGDGSNPRDLPRQMSLLASGTPSTSSHAATGKRGVLNPEHSRWLMGLPRSWSLCGRRAFAKQTRR